MNPLQSLIAIFATFQVDLTARFNEALSNRPPLEQAEGASAALNVLRDIEWGRERLVRLGESMATTLQAAATIIPGFEYRPGEAVDSAASRLIEVQNAQIVDVALTTAITAKTHLPFGDHQAALDNAVLLAKQETKTEVESEFTAKLDDARKLSERRTGLIAKIGVVASGSVADTDLLAEDHEARIAIVEDRISTLASISITAETRPLNFASLLACGEDEFQSRVEMVKEGGVIIPITAAAPAAPAPSTPSGVIPSGTSEKKAAVI